MIVVTAPTGQIGSKLVAALLAAGAPVRVVVRDAERLPTDVRGAVEVVEGSHGDGAVMARALAGADALFWLAPPDMSRTLQAAYLDFTRPAADAIRAAGTPRVVAVTALGRGTPWQHKAGLVTASIAADDLLMATGAAFRALAMPSFMENTARQVGPMKASGMFFGPIDPDRKLPFTATPDMAEAAARLLLDGAWTGQEEVPVLGPDDLSFDDQAAIISEVTGRTVRYQQIGWDRFRQQFLDRGADESWAQGYVDMFRAKEEGIDNVAVRQAGRHGTTSFRQFAEQQLRPALAG